MSCFLYLPDHRKKCWGSCSYLQACCISNCHHCHPECRGRGRHARARLCTLELGVRSVSSENDLCKDFAAAVHRSHVLIRCKISTRMWTPKLYQCILRIQPWLCMPCQTHNSYIVMNENFCHSDYWWSILGNYDSNTQGSNGSELGKYSTVSNIGCLLTSLTNDPQESYL